MENILNSEIERAALALFARDASVEYKRILCYVVAHEVGQATLKQVKTVQHNLKKSHNYPEDDIQSAMSVLKSPFAFNGLRVFNTRRNANEDPRLSCSGAWPPELSQWLSEIEREYPHVRRMVA